MTKGELSVALKLTKQEEWKAVQKYLEEEKTKATAALLNATDAVQMHRLQGEIKKLELLISLDVRFEKILREMSNA